MGEGVRGEDDASAVDLLVARTRRTSTAPCSHAMCRSRPVTPVRAIGKPRLRRRADRAKGGFAVALSHRLCVGLVHGDLSEFNVLMSAEGPVIIDLPQAVDAAGNNNAPTMLARDVANITRYYARYVPEIAQTRYAEELWAAYEDGALHPDMPLTGRFERDESEVDVGSVLQQIEEAFREEMEKRERLADG